MSIPEATVNSPRMSDQVSSQFDRADTGLSKAMKNGRARKHLPEGMLDQMRQQRNSTVAGTKQADEAQNQAPDSFRKTSEDSTNPQNLVKDFRSNLSRPESLQNFATSQVASSNLPGVLDNLDGITDQNQLMELLQNEQMRGRGLSQNQERLKGQQTSQINTNRGFSSQFKKFGGLEKSFASKEKAFDAKDKLFQNISKTMKTAGKALATAATAVDAAAAGVEAAAMAVAAIPFIGAALSMALKVIAKSLKVVAKGLKTMGKMMDKMGTKMDGVAKKMKSMTSKMKSSKLANKAKKLVSKSKLDQGFQKLQKIRSQVKKVTKELGSHRKNLAKISERMEHLGLQVPKANQNDSFSQQQLRRNLGLPGSVPPPSGRALRSA